MNTHSAMSSSTIEGYAALSRWAPLVPFEYPAGPLGAEQVEIAVNYCGTCRFDIAMIDDAWGYSAFPLVPGHEEIVWHHYRRGATGETLTSRPARQLGLAVCKLHGHHLRPIERRFAAPLPCLRQSYAHAFEPADSSSEERHHHHDPF